MNTPTYHGILARIHAHAPRLAGLGLAMALATNAAPALAGSWGATKTLQSTFAASSPPEAPILAANGKGHTVAVWNAVGWVSYAEHSKGGTWSKSATVVPGATGNAIAVAIGADETTAIAWTTVATRYVASKLVVSIREPNGPFAQPAEIAPGAAVWYPKLGIAADGTATLVWSDAGKVYASSRPRGGAWSAARMLSAGQGANLPDLVVNDAGAALAVWQEGAGGNPSVIAAAYRPATGDWQAADQVSSGGASTWNPKPGLDAGGNAVVGYLEGNAMVVASRPANGAWSMPETVSAPGFTVYYPALAMNANGDVIAAWQAYDAAGNISIRERTRLAGAGWSAAIRLSSAADTPGWPTAAFSGDGLGVVSWVDDAAQLARASVRNPADATWKRYALGTGWWGSTVPVSAAGGSIAAAWAVPRLANPNAATLVGKIYE